MPSVIILCKPIMNNSNIVIVRLDTLKHINIAKGPQVLITRSYNIYNWSNINENKAKL